MELHSATGRQYRGQTEENNENTQNCGPLKQKSNQKFLESKAGVKGEEGSTQQDIE